MPVALAEPIAIGGAVVNANTNTLADGERHANADPVTDRRELQRQLDQRPR